MFYLKTLCGKYYTGRAGDGWVSDKQSEAFIYSSRGAAERKAFSHNQYTRLHGLTFNVEGR